MSIERKDVENIAQLARLQLEEGEVEEVTASLANILALVDQMGQADTAGVAPLAHPLDASQRLREDEVTEENRRDELQRIAPSVERGLFLVPKVID